MRTEVERFPLQSTRQRRCMRRYARAEWMVVISIGAEKLPPFWARWSALGVRLFAVRSVAAARQRLVESAALRCQARADDRLPDEPVQVFCAGSPAPGGATAASWGPSRSAVIASGAGPMPCVGWPCSGEDIVLTAQRPGRSFHAEGQLRHAVVVIVAASGKPKEEAAGYGWASRTRQCRQSSQSGGMRALRLPSLSGRQLPITASWNQPSLRFAWSQTMICKAPLLSWTTSLRSWK